MRTLSKVKRILYYNLFPNKYLDIGLTVIYGCAFALLASFRYGSFGLDALTIGIITCAIALLASAFAIAKDRGWGYLLKASVWLVVSIDFALHGEYIWPVFLVIAAWSNWMCYAKGCE